MSQKLRLGVTVCSLEKQPGLSLATHGALWRLLRELQPDDQDRRTKRAQKFAEHYDFRINRK